MYMGYRSVACEVFRCEEIKISSDDGHSLSGIFFPASGAPISDTSSSQSPDALFFYLRGSNLHSRPPGYTH